MELILFDFPRMRHSPGSTKVVWLPTSAASTAELWPPLPKRQKGGRKCHAPNTKWYNCADFVRYLEEVAGISFEEAFQLWFDARSSADATQRFNFDFKIWELLCYIPETSRGIRTAGFQ